MGDEASQPEAATEAVIQCVCLKVLKPEDGCVAILPYPGGLVCCEACWQSMSVFERSLLQLLTTPPHQGGLNVGPVLARVILGMVKPDPAPVQPPKFVADQIHRRRRGGFGVT